MREWAGGGGLDGRGSGFELRRGGVAGGRAEKEGHRCVGMDPW